MSDNEYPCEHGIFGGCSICHGRAYDEIAQLLTELEQMRGELADAWAECSRLRSALLRVRPCVACTMMSRELLPVIDAALATHGPEGE